MINHYHLVIETPDANLSRGMRQLNGVYAQYSNRRHRRTGHLFQGRFKGILVDGDSYLLELSRYVVLNPVRAGMVTRPGAWPWSSYATMMGIVRSPAWLETDGLLAAFGKRRRVARQRYKAFVLDGIDADSIWRNLQAQAFLGDDEFVARSLKHANVQDDVNIPKSQRRAPPPPLDIIARSHATRDEAIVASHASGGYSYAEIADYFGVHFTTVGRIVRASKSAK
ncbi:hypothetical protein C84B14_17583 [Salinisphaera sp. C84B14]|uniref:transposase n=1 Tax=Salinisphaera sp. C84B14 TaxID=1304155 RepID=UPI003340F00C